MLVWLSVWSKVRTCIQPSWCHCHSLSLASVKSRSAYPGSPEQRAIKWVCVCSVPTHLIHCSLERLPSHPKQAHDWFSCFCTIQHNPVCAFIEVGLQSPLQTTVKGGKTIRFVNSSTYCFVIRYLEYLRFDLMKEVDEFDIGWQQQLTCWCTAVIELGVEQLKLCQRARHTDRPTNTLHTYWHRVLSYKMHYIPKKTRTYIF